MSHSTGDRIRQVLSEIAQLEDERGSITAKIDPLSELNEESRKRNAWYLQRLEALNRTLDPKRQELISLELVSLNDYSNSMNQNIAKLDDSIKSLETTTNKLLRSSRTLEVLTQFLILIAVANIAFLFLSFPPLGPYLALVALVPVFVVMVLTWRRGKTIFVR